MSHQEIPLGPTETRHSKDKVCYFYNESTAKYHYSDDHPMKPARLALTHNLIAGYGLHQHMETFVPHRATEHEMTEFHTEDYVEFLKRVSPANLEAFGAICSRYKVGGGDCPAFEGLFDFCKLYTGASLEGANKLCEGADIAINWSGGLHHAKKFEASGFCYINDIVLAILQLLRVHQRVLYVDIDVHHGDGVQEAFYETNRVLTVSFHRYDGLFFPGTGDITETGSGRGRHHSLNVPLHSFIDDESYRHVFEGVMTDVMAAFRPGAVVLQCGADSLAADKLGSFNLSIKGHGACVAFMKRFGVPMLVLGGGGYTVRNVARAWTYETGVCCGVELPNALPPNEFLPHFGPDFSLHPDIVNRGWTNANSREYLDDVRARIAEELRAMGGPPSVGLQEIPDAIPAAVVGGGGIGFGGDVDALADEAEDMWPDRRVGAVAAVGGEGAGRRERERATVDERELYAGERDQDHEGGLGDGVVGFGSVDEGEDSLESKPPKSSL
ncbi:Histone deacetylase 3 [Phlyctochytrium bullatum]|nr:Histone deacetylase 3 [Phlyctochytrium bullatum]